MEKLTQAFSTIAIHQGQDPDKWDSKCVVTPIVLATTFKQAEAGKYLYEYSRCDNPTRQALEECLAGLEEAKEAHCYSSGVACITAISFLLKTGQHVLLCDDVYSGTYNYFSVCASRMGIESTYVNMIDLNLVKQELRPNTAMIWIESPTNPTLKLIDIRAVCETVRETHPNVIVVVDNTFCSTYYQRPLELGANLVMQSLTKYMNGHTDVTMGVVCSNNDEFNRILLSYQMILGGIPSPFDCYMVLRGLKTLEIRMRQHMQNALRIAQWLETNPRVEKVLYPPLESHPQHELYKKQMKGFGGMMGIYLKANLEQTTEFLKNLKVVTLAVSLGGYETLVEHPAIMTHLKVPKEIRDKLGIGDNFLRISIGLEDAQDIINDFEQALEKAIPQI